MSFMPSVLEIEGLSKVYGSFTAVRDVSLRVDPGEIVALLGPNGAGKTTTIKMIMGILRATRGTARVRGHDCFADRAEVMGHVGYVPDDPVFYDYLRGGELIQFVGDMHGLSSEEVKERSAPLMERLDLGDALDEFAVNYSRGMKKKLGLICALIHRPDLLILDEPTNGLDPFATRTLHDLIREVAEQGASVFYSTHLLDHAERICSRACILHEGRLAAEGTLEVLQQSLTAGGSLEDVFFQVAREGGADPALGDEPS